MVGSRQNYEVGEFKAKVVRIEAFRLDLTAWIAVAFKRTGDLNGTPKFGAADWSL